MMLHHALAFLVWFQVPASPSATPSQDEIKDSLVRAESLYYEAKFSESIQVLTRLNETLRNKPDRVQDRISVKLQTSLAYIGLNDSAAAKTFLIEVYALDPDYALDARQFSPKVVSLANDAKAEQGVLRCRTALDNGRTSVAAGNTPALLDILRSMKPKCSELASLEPEAAELVYRKGLAAYKSGDFTSALQNLNTALKLAPKHELASEYLQLAESKLQISEERAFLQWQKNFDARQFKQAAVDYRQIASLTGDEGDTATLDRATAQYRKALSVLAERWSQACRTNDALGMNTIHGETTELLPEPSFGEDIRTGMTCAPVANPAPVKVSTISLPGVESGNTTNPPVNTAVSMKVIPAASIIVQPVASTGTPVVGCFQMDEPLALARLKSRVEPEISREAGSYLQNSKVTVKVKVRIDEKGNAAVSGGSGGNILLVNAVQDAMKQWKFTPAMSPNGPRCVDTELSMTLSGKL